MFRRFSILVGMFLWAGIGFAADQQPSFDELVARLPHFTIAGKVVDKSGNAVAGADVFVYYTRSENGLRDRLVTKGKSADDGSFRFENAGVWEPLAADREDQGAAKHAVFARHPEHGIEFVNLIPGDPTEGLKITLEGAKTYKVKAVDMQGEPVEGAKVFLCDLFHEGSDLDTVADRQRRHIRISLDIGLSSAMTGANGEAELAGPIRDPNFIVTKRGFTQGWGDGTITLCPSARVFGRVSLADGRPAAGAAVALEYMGDRLVHSEATLADAQGRFEFPDTAASGFRFGNMPADAQKDARGTVSLTASDLRPGSNLVSRKISAPVNPGDNIKLDLTLTKACTVSGQVVDITTGRPVPKLRMRGYYRTDAPSSFQSLTVITDAEGKFTTSVPPETRLTFQWDSGQQSDCIIDSEWRSQGNWQPIQGQLVKADLTGLVLKVKLWPVQKLSGKVVDAQGSGVKNAFVYMHSEVPPVRTGEDGTFALALAPTDRDFTLAAVLSDRSQAGLVQLKAGSNQATIALQPTRSYSGQVLNTEGLPASNLTFYMDLRINGQDIYRAREQPTTDAQGKFTAAKLIPGATYYAWWSSDNDQNRDYDYGNATIDLSKLAENQTITFTAKQYLNTLIGTIVNSEGQPIEGAVINAGYTDLLPQDARMNQRIRTDRKGQFAIQRLAAGQLTFKVSAPNCKTGTFRAPTDAIDFQGVLKPLSDKLVCNLTIVDEQDRPMPDAPVQWWLISSEETQKKVTGGKARAGADGRARVELPAVSNQIYAICCDVPGKDLAFCRVGPNEDADLRIVLHNTTRNWNGVVLSNAGRPVADVTVRITGTSQDLSSPDAHVSLGVAAPPELAKYLTYTTDADGRFALNRLGLNWVNVQITAPGYALVDEYFDPRAGSTATKQFTLSAAGFVQGRIILKSTGKAPPGQPDVILNLVEAGSGRGANVKVNADWTFTSQATPPGQYRIMFYPRTKELRRFVAPQRDPVRIEEQKPVDVVLELEEGIPLKGRIVASKPELLEQTYVMATLKADSTSRIGTRPEKDGSFEMYLPSEGEYQIAYYTQGLQQPKELKTIRVEKNRPTEALKIEVDAAPGR